MKPFGKPLNEITNFVMQNNNVSMKQIITFTIVCVVTTVAFGQSAKYMDAMSAALTEMDAAQTADQMLAMSNKFERIAMAEKIEWLPFYYAALARTTAVFMSENQNKTDEILDVAEKYALKADSLMPNSSEIYVLRSMITGGRIMVDPTTRGQQYGMQSMMLMNQAMTLDPANPRSYYVMGQSLFYTPPQFGGGKDKGCEMMATAKEKYKTFTPASEIHPRWGEQQLDQSMKESCQEFMQQD